MQTFRPGQPIIGDPASERVVALVADLLNVPIAFLALFENGRARILAAVGLVPEADHDLPAQAPLTDPSSRVVPDMAGEADLLVLPGVRFYAGAPLTQEDGTMIGVLCAVDTVPRAPPSARDMRRLEDLAALARDALDARRAVETAQAVADAQAERLADLSHELRTPLNGIMGLAEILRRDAPVGVEAFRGMDRIAEASRGLLMIVDDALDVARRGVVRQHARAFSPSRLIEDAVAMVRPEAERKGLRLALDLPARVADFALGDPDRLRQVLLNLLANAVKFTETGTVRASLAVAERAGPALDLTFAVADSGVGIAKEGLPRLFQRFSQADGTVARRFGGTGLGLAISKGLVDAMGGVITVESAMGAGARFAVALSLPRVAEPAVVAPVAASLAQGSRGALEGSAVLLAEDVPLNSKLAVQMLSPLGAEVDVVDDGLAAVAAVARRDYALVLMDMEMPVLGGLDAARRIRLLDGRAGTVPIVALTANVFPEQLDLCRAAGMDDHLTKPFGADDLAAKVLRWARRLAPVD